MCKLYEISMSFKFMLEKLKNNKMSLKITSIIFSKLYHKYQIFLTDNAMKNKSDKNSKDLSDSEKNDSS